MAAEVYLALLRRDRLLLVRFDPRFRLSTYLGILCRTEVLRWLRRRGRAGVALDRPEGIPGPPVGEGPLALLAPAERDEALQALRAALLDLPRRDRLLLELRYLDGLSYRGIAEALDLAPESLGPLLARARRRLARRAPGLRGLIEG